MSFSNLSQEFQEVLYHQMISYAQNVIPGVQMPEWLWFMEDARDALLMGGEL